MLTWKKRIASLAIAAGMLLQSASVVGFADGAAAGPAELSLPVYERTVLEQVADPSTFDTWQARFAIDTTEYTGGVWADKSVEAKPNGSSPGDRFDVMLSAISSTQSISGSVYLPTDVMMILDISSSMYVKRGMPDNDTIASMLTAVNESIDRLFSLNPNNRVGVTLYYGSGDIMTQTKNADGSKVLLPLDHYSRDGYSPEDPDKNEKYIEALTGTDGYLEFIRVNEDVKNSEGKKLGKNKYTYQTPKDHIAGTYTQQGILDAMNEFLRVEPTLNGDPRQPVFILMSDGEPTAATHLFWDDGANAMMGNNQVVTRQPNETDFVTQLAAAYAKKKVDDHYVHFTPSFYTLSLGSSISYDVMDPASRTGQNNVIEDYWDTLVNHNSVKINPKYFGGWWDYNDDKTPSAEYKDGLTVAKRDSFPSDVDQRLYVDSHYVSDTADKLMDNFNRIVDIISLKTRYFATRVDGGDPNMSGDVSFVDKIGEYMTVTDIKEIKIGANDYTGSKLAESVVGGNAGAEFPANVKSQLGLESDLQAAELIKLAIAHGQLAYASPSDYSNYIGWYGKTNTADGKIEYVNFWYEGDQNPPSDAQFIIKSYFYSGTVDDSNNTAKSNMMYITVWHRTAIPAAEDKFSEETVIFSIPASLLPTVVYNLELDSGGELRSFERDPANPIRLVYEVGLREDITPYNIKEKLDADYLSKNTNPDGSVRFYTNQFDTSVINGGGVSGFGVNTYDYFRPSHENDRYYFTEDTPVLDKNYQGYNGSAAPVGEYYRAYEVYEKGKTEPVTKYNQLTADALGAAEKGADGWYIPRGTIRMNTTINASDLDKEHNYTETFPYYDIPIIEHFGSGVSAPDHDYIIGAIQGNNGRISLMPDTGLKLTKAVTEYYGSDNASKEFNFTLSRVWGANESGPDNLTVITVGENGTAATESRSLEKNGSLSVSAKAADTVYITGLTPNASYTVTEVQEAEYKLVSVNNDPELKEYTFTAVSGEMKSAAFVNTARHFGTLAVAKAVRHSDDRYTVPVTEAAREFSVNITLTGDYVRGGTFDAVHSGDSTLTKAVVDADGAVKLSTGDTGAALQEIALKSGDNLLINGLPEGTTATVTETLPDSDLYPGSYEVKYYENIDGSLTPISGSESPAVTIAANRNVAVGIENIWTPEPIAVPLTVEVTKNFADWDITDQFAFVLEQYDNEKEVWKELDTVTLGSTDLNYGHLVVSPTLTTESEGGVPAEKNIPFTVDIAVSGNGIGTGEGETDIFAATHSGNSDVAKAQVGENGKVVLLDSTGMAVKTPISSAPDECDGGSSVEPAYDYGIKLKHGETLIIKSLPAETAVKIIEAPAGEEYSAPAYSAERYNNRLEFTMPVENQEIKIFGGFVTAMYIDNIWNAPENAAGDGQGAPSSPAAEDNGISHKRVPFDFAALNIANTATFLSDEKTGIVFDKPGTYTFQVYEKVPDIIYDSSNIFYDPIWHIFAVRVGYSDSGVLEVKEAHELYDHDGNDATHEVTITSSGAAVTVAANFAFTNTYQTEIPAQVTLDILKSMQDSGSPLVDASGYSFEIYTDETLQTLAAVGAPTGLSDIKRYNVTDGAGEAWFDLFFDKIGDYTFYIKEVPPSPVNDKIKYSETLLKVDITIDNVERKNDADVPDKVTYEGIGASSVSVTKICDDAGREVDTAVNVPVEHNGYITTVSLWENKTAGEGESAKTDRKAPFTNVYIPRPDIFPKGSPFDFTVTKTLTGRTLAADEFSFVIEDAAGAVVAEGKNDADGKVVFKRVGDNIEPPVGLPDDADITNALLFFTRAGVFDFEIYETSADTANIRVDRRHYHLRVTVEDTGGQLEVTDATILEDPDLNIVFQNSFNQGSVKHSIELTKAFIDALDNEIPVTNSMFTFVMMPVDENGTSLPAPDNYVYVASNDANGNVVFDELMYTKPGTHRYLLREQAGSTAHVVYDDSVYMAEVTVANDAADPTKLIASHKLYKWNGSEKGQEVNGPLTFTNRYSVEPIEVSFEGLKILGNTLLTELEADDFNFAFDLYESDSAWTQGSLLKTVTADTPEHTVDEPNYPPHQHFTFGDHEKLRYTMAGTHYYLIKEHTGTSSIADDRLDYDDTVYGVKVDVTLDKDSGTLNAAASIVSVVSLAGTDKIEIPQNDITFINRKVVDAKYSISGTKTLTGRRLRADEFVFNLYRTDSTFTLAQDAVPLETVKNKADGTFAFSEMTVSNMTIADNGGNKFYYVVREDSSANLYNVTYDKSEFRVAVEVNKNDESHLIPSVTVEKAITVTVPPASDAPAGTPPTTQTTVEPTANILFANTYTPDDDDDEPKPEQPKPEKPTDNPDMGDELNPTLWLTLTAVSALGILVLLFVLGKLWDEESDS